VAPVVTMVIRLFQMTKCEKCLECVSVAVETFGALPGAADNFAELLGEVAGHPYRARPLMSPKYLVPWRELVLTEECWSFAGESSRLARGQRANTTIGSRPYFSLL